jgi:hypothetical protein
MNALLLAIYDRIKAEPVMTAQLVQSVIACAVLFGLHWTPEQIAAVVVLANIAIGWLTRSQVTPNVKLPQG